MHGFSGQYDIVAEKMTVDVMLRFQGLGILHTEIASVRGVLGPDHLNKLYKEKREIRSR